MTALRLAEHVAKTVDVDCMLESMTPGQFEEWRAKDLLEPIGHSGTHEILSMIGALIANYLGSKDQNDSPIDQWHFKWWQERPPQAEATVEGMFAALEMIGAKRG